MIELDGACGIAGRGAAVAAGHREIGPCRNLRGARDLEADLALVGLDDVGALKGDGTVGGHYLRRCGRRRLAAVCEELSVRDGLWNP